MNLTPKQKAFADYYIECGNSTEAARKAAISDLERREQSKLGLAKRKSNIAPPQKPSYEQQIWSEIAAARDSSIF